VCDVRDRAQVKSLFDFAISRFGRVDIAINNAGIGIFAPLGKFSTEDWHRVIETNLTGVFHCSQEALSHFGPKGGYIFQIGSLAGKNPFAGGAAYNASKFALNGFSEALMLDHRYDNIRVTTICPGSVDTDFAPRAAVSPWKIQPEDIADIVVSLLRLPARTMVSYVEVRPSQPKKG
jgi:3-oxoacyl-[acyl-carrier protein] reductase